MMNKSNIINTLKKEQNILAVILFTIILLVFLGININATKIDDEELIHQAMQQARNKIEEELRNKIAIDTERVSQQLKLLKKTDMEVEELASYIFDFLSFNEDYYKIEAYEILINDSSKILVTDKATATKVLEEIKLSYIPKEKKEMIKEVDFVDDVRIMPVFATQSNIVTKEEAINKLKSTTEEIKKYIISQGDTLSEVANNHGMKYKELMKINPDLKEDSILKIGQEINLTVPKPLVSVRTSEKFVYTEPIEKKIEYQYDDSKFTDYRNVILQGKDGLKEITANKIRINGLEEDNIIVSEKVLEEPVTEIVVVGTKELRMPVYGRITSLYGARWGTTHEGIDIAAPSGTSIAAAESGTVIYSGWNDGGYGNLIKINHGNGLVTYYAHNSKNYVGVGDYVNKGDIIAAVGSTGNSTGPHVHFEVREDGAVKNPSNYF